MAFSPLSDWLEDQVSALWDAEVCNKAKKPKKKFTKVQVRHFVTRPTIFDLFHGFGAKSDTVLPA